MTKAEARAVVRDLLDDPDGQRWSNARLDALVSVTLDDLWSVLLDEAPYYRSTLETLSGSPKLASPGVIALTELADRFVRPQKVTRDGYEYGPADPREIVIEGNERLVGPLRTYTRLGGSLWLFPLDAATEVEFRYSSRPTAFRSLSDDDEVEWPDGYEAAYLHEAAGRSMLKGAAEDPSGHLAISGQAMRRLLAKVGREHPGPSVAFATDSPLHWGG